jgi:hypothetical protein
MARKFGLFAHSILSLDSCFSDLEVEIAEKSLATPANIPVCGDCGRRLGAEVIPAFEPIADVSSWLTTKRPRYGF